VVLVVEVGTGVDAVPTESAVTTAVHAAAWSRMPIPDLSLDEEETPAPADRPVYLKHSSNPAAAEHGARGRR
jgi:hypothetical protein